MSIWKMLKPLWELFSPQLCVVCHSPLLSGEQDICTICRTELPITNQLKSPYNNRLLISLYDQTGIYSAASFFYYDKNSIYSTICRGGKNRTGISALRTLSQWFGGELARHNTFYNIDVVVPVPLHPRKEGERGFNQAAVIAAAIAQALGVPMCTDGVIRHRDTSDQKRAGDKWQRTMNVEGAFLVIDSSKLEGKHILVVDDVITTGATITQVIIAINKGAIDCNVSACSLCSVKPIILR